MRGRLKIYLGLLALLGGLPLSLPEALYADIRANPQISFFTDPVPQRFCAFQKGQFREVSREDMVAVWREKSDALLHAKIQWIGAPTWLGRSWRLSKVRVKVLEVIEGRMPAQTFVLYFGGKTARDSHFKKVDPEKPYYILARLIQTDSFPGRIHALPFSYESIKAFNQGLCAPKP